jgi:DNA-binding beta-propeller fold protein YncE
MSLPGNDPFSGSNVQNALQHTLSPKIVKDDANTGYKLQTDLIGVNNVYVTGSVYSNGLDIVRKITNITGVDNLIGYKQLCISETTGKIYYFPLSYFVRTIAGSGEYTPFANGNGTSATFYAPNAGVVDGSGNLYIADTFNNRIRKMTPSGVVTTFAGSGVQGFKDDDTATSAKFYYPGGITIDSSGTNLYVADTFNHTIRKIVISSGAVTTVAGLATDGAGVGAFADDTGTSARFNRPYGITIDNSGNLYVADSNNNRIRKIVISTGEVTTFAGSGVQDMVNDTGILARFYRPIGITRDSSGNLYVSEIGNSLIRKIDTSAVVTTFAGFGGLGFVDGTGTNARFNQPYGITIDNSGNLYVADTTNHCIRKIVISTQVVTTIGGDSPQSGYVDAVVGNSARFNSPRGIASDASGENIYVMDTGNLRIRKIQKETITL